MTSDAMLPSGLTVPLPKPLALRAGPLTAIFEPHTGFLRYVRLGDHEVVRAIYGAVRDRNWATVPSELTNLETDVGSSSFRLSFDVLCRSRLVHYAWHGIITGDSSGKITFSFAGQARAPFQRNRIGLCVNHPVAECAGQPCVVEHTGGAESKGVFPRTIAPGPVFLDVRALEYPIASTAVTAVVRFDGEVFETEDQRNWTDASFKTYSTPAARPAPVEVQAGEQIRQTVSLSLKNLSRPILPVLQGRPPQISIATTPMLPLPGLGLCMARHGQALSSRAVQRLRALKLSHLRVDLDLSSPDYAAALQEAAQQARELGAGLHLAVTLSEAAVEELRSLGEHLRSSQPRILLWLVFSKNEGVTDSKLLTAFQAALQGHYPGALVAAGSRQFFADVNAARPNRDSRAYVCYPANPQVHFPDQLTMVECLAGQAHTVETVREFSSKPAVLSPITLRSPFNPQMSLAEESPGSLPGDVDPRQRSLFCAGWTLGSMARVAATGNAHSLTYYETTGWRGVMETEAGSPRPEKFPSRPGEVFPVYHLLADVGEFGGQLYPTHSSDPLSVEAMTLVDGQRRRRMLVANLSSEPLEVKIKSGTCQARIRYLDETNALEAMSEPETFRAQPGMEAEAAGGKIELRLQPFALARVDVQ